MLILDEPIAQLDPMHADRIYAVLRELNEVHGKTIIVIEHHTEYIADFCRHVLLMKDGRVQWMLPTREALQRVDELEDCNIFPPQVTQAAHRLRKLGRLPGKRASAHHGGRRRSSVFPVCGTPRGKRRARRRPLLRRAPSRSGTCAFLTAR